jgi:hypothetical protein
MSTAIISETPLNQTRKWMNREDRPMAAWTETIESYLCTITPSTANQYRIARMTV